MIKIAATAALLLLAMPALANDADTTVLAGPCSACHGPEGQGSGAIPAIKGRPADLLLDQLRGFRSGALPSTVMGRLAKGYDDEQLARLAKHFAGTK